MVASLPADRSEQPAHQEPAIRLHRDAKNRIVRIRIKRIRATSFPIDSSNPIARLAANARKRSCDHNPSIRLERDGTDEAVRVRVESKVERSVSVQPRNIVATYTQ